MITFPLRLDTDVARPEFNRLRTRANDLARADDWAGLHALAPELQADTELWTDLWGPACAIAAVKVGDPSAMDLLARLAAAGFSQLEMFGPELAGAFGTDPRWPSVRDQIAGNAGSAPLLLTGWPVLAPAAPLGLLDLPSRADELRALLPAPAQSAWQTALALLRWVTERWVHADAHIEVDDAVECLRRVDQGQRFACVEYSLVLSQALNALAIPARRLALRQPGYHAGVGRGHVVSEAWIDELSRWVVLDGQNGLYWTGADGKPAAAPELQELALSGGQRPGFVPARDGLSDADADVWFSYFAHVTSSAGTVAPGAFGMLFQRSWIRTSRRLERRPDALYPDLSQIGVETAVAAGRPALRLSCAHPYARGFAADGDALPGDVVALDLSPGKHVMQLSVRTDYGLLAGQRLSYQVG
jgi:hypothetical protein